MKDVLLEVRRNDKMRTDKGDFGTNFSNDKKYDERGLNFIITPILTLKNE